MHIGNVAHWCYSCKIHINGERYARYQKSYTEDDVSEYSILD